MDFTEKGKEKLDMELKDLTEEVDSEENVERGNWSGKFDFILSCLGYAVGLGNVWRFPYLCYKNGGGAFFIPYFIFLIFVGTPIFFLELSIGQFTSQGPLTCWANAPLFNGIGLAMLLVSILVGVYYNVIIAWAIWYLCASFTNKLPWEDCNGTSSFQPTALCWERYRNISQQDCITFGGESRSNGACYVNNTLYAIYNETLGKQNGLAKRTPSEDYLNQVGFRLDDAAGIENLGPLRWDMSLALLASWTIVLLCLIKGIKSSGKVVYFTALFPYVVLIILFIRGLMTDGFERGIKFYITANVTKLSEAEVWKDAAAQIFFSLSTSFGGLIVLSSYNKFRNNIIRDTLIVCIGNSLTSIFAGFVIFSYLGALSKALNVSVADVAASGPALAFIVYPQAVTYLPFPPIWSILFFVMLITLGLDSEFALIETVTTCITDSIKRRRGNNEPLPQRQKTAIIGTTCLIGFFLSLPMATCGGPYLLTIIDDYSGGWNVMLIAFCECVCIAWVYGARQFCEDIRVMLGGRFCGLCQWTGFRWLWIVNWTVITPILVLFIMVFSLVKYQGSKYGMYVFPLWANVMGWLMTMLVVVGLFAPAIVNLILSKGSIRERFREQLTPSKYWGPALIQHREEVKNSHAPSMVIDPWLSTGQGNVNYTYKEE